MNTYSHRLASMFIIALTTSALLTFWLATTELIDRWAPFSLDWTGSWIVLFSFYFFLVFDVLVLAIETTSPSYMSKNNS